MLQKGLRQQSLADGVVRWLRASHGRDLTNELMMLSAEKADEIVVDFLKDSNYPPYLWASNKKDLKEGIKLFYCSTNELKGQVQQNTTPSLSKEIHFVLDTDRAPPTWSRGAPCNDNQPSAEIPFSQMVSAECRRYETDLATGNELAIPNCSQFGLQNVANQPISDSGNILSAAWPAAPKPVSGTIHGESCFMSVYFH
ncbi:MAG: hypothetical protein LQ341_003841 [Variospora aurantia]|nr:MAG: hypothetical protein LQ341_003841 [Variospora aurantia]